MLFYKRYDAPNIARPREDAISNKKTDKIEKSIRISLQKWRESLGYKLEIMAVLYPTSLVFTSQRTRDCRSTPSTDLSTPAKRTRIIYFLIELAGGPARFRGVRLTNK